MNSCGKIQSFPMCAVFVKTCLPNSTLIWRRYLLIFGIVKRTSAVGWFDWNIAARPNQAMHVRTGRPSRFPMIDLCVAAR